MGSASYKDTEASKGTEGRKKGDQISIYSLHLMIDTIYIL